jgi:hypothetical protein
MVSHLKHATNQPPPRAFFGLALSNGGIPCGHLFAKLSSFLIENFAPCEYLASHGYVVISVPVGDRQRYLEGGTVKKSVHKLEIWNTQSDSNAPQ